MSEIISEHTDLSEADHHWLKLLVSEWQLLADLSFSDLVLWVLDRDPNVFWAAAQIRPFTGVTSLFDDVVGDLIAYSPEHLVSEAFLSGEIVQTSEPNCRRDCRSTPMPSRSKSASVSSRSSSSTPVSSAYAERRAHWKRRIWKRQPSWPG